VLVKYLEGNSAFIYVTLQLLQSVSTQDYLVLSSCTPSAKQRNHHHLYHVRMPISNYLDEEQSAQAELKCVWLKGQTL